MEILKKIAIFMFTTAFIWIIYLLGYLVIDFYSRGINFAVFLCLLVPTVVIFKRVCSNDNKDKKK